MSRITVNSRVGADVCPMCRRPYADMPHTEAKKQSLIIEISNTAFEVTFHGFVCQACYQRVTQTHQNNLFDWEIYGGRHHDSKEAC